MGFLWHTKAENTVEDAHVARLAAENGRILHAIQAVCRRLNLPDPQYRGKDTTIIECLAVICDRLDALEAQRRV